MQHTRRTTGDRGGVATGVDPVTGGLEAEQRHIGVRHERGEDADRVRAATDAGGNRVRQSPDPLQHLGAGLVADDALEFPHHQRERVWPGHRPEEVVGGLHVGDPVTEGLVDGVLQRLGTSGDRDHLSAQEPHPGDVEGLAAGVLAAHVDRAFQPEQGRCGGGGHPVLSGAGLGDDPLLADALGQQGLPEDIIDLVRSGVVEVLALEQDPGATGLGRELRHVGQRGRPAGVVAQQPGQLAGEVRVGLCGGERRRQVVQRGDQGFGDEPATVATEVPGGVGHGGDGHGGGKRHRRCSRGRGERERTRRRRVQPRHRRPGAPPPAGSEPQPARSEPQPRLTGTSAGWPDGSRR